MHEETVQLPDKIHPGWEVTITSIAAPKLLLLLLHILYVISVMQR